MPQLSVVRKAITWIALGLFGAVAFGTISEWFIHVAEDKGWYENAGKNWDRLMNELIILLTSPSLTYLTVGVVCFAAGMWIDYLLYRRERAPIEEAMAQASIDRQKLARDAMKVGKAVLAHAAEGDARQRVAFEADSNAKRGGGFSRDQSAREEEITIGGYAKQFHGEVWRIIDAASRVINLDGSAVWRISHNVSSSHQLHTIGQLLISISNHLKFPGNPILPDTREIERQQQIIAQAAAPQLQRGDGPGTPQ
jgi:hypothetical protein